MQSISAYTLIESLKYWGVNPEFELTAAAGPDYGYLEAWNLSNGYWVYTLCNVYNSTEYGIAYDRDELTKKWNTIYPTGTDHLNAILMEANLYGVRTVRKAEPDSSGPFAILLTKHFPDTREFTTAFKGMTGEYATFRNYKEAYSKAVYYDWDEKESPYEVKTFTIVNVGVQI